MGGPVIEDQSRQNRSTANQWSLYSTHRRALEKLLVPSRWGSDSLCVVGAGNCNDLDLKWLMQAYREVHLVDIDPDALSAAVKRQGVADAPHLHLHAPLDLTGAADDFARWSLKPPGFDEIDGLIDRLLRAAPLPLPVPFDAVLSPCVLTQLISPARKALGNDHPKLPVLRLAMRDGHLRSLAHLLRPGGRVILAIDLASSKTFENLQRVPLADLPDLMRTLIDRNKTYFGLDPTSLKNAIRLAPLRSLFHDPLFTLPWHWHLSLQRTFLVYGVTLVRSAITT